MTQNECPVPAEESMDLATRLRLAFGIATLSCGVAAAEPQQIVMSLTDGVTLPSGIADDEELIAVAPGLAPRKFLSDTSLALYFGDRNNDGLFDEPNDIDALAFLSSVPFVAMTESLVFSLLSDQNGIKDGDVVRFAPQEPVTGLEVLFSEAFLAAAISANDGNIDVDAMAFGPDGAFWFSLAEDESTGPQSIVMQDDTVFVLAVGASTASVAFTAGQMETFAKTALGVTTSTVDVLALEFAGNDLLFTVQSPTAHDATILSVANGGMVWAGATEATFGFGADVECDALALFSGSPFSSLDAEPAAPTSGVPLVVTLDGATPNTPVLLVLSGTVAKAGAGWPVAGFGALVPSPFDPIFLAGVANAPALVAVTDPAGIVAYSGAAPSAGGVGLDLAVQAYDSVTARFSSPVVIELQP
jgi:hypothetical protein